jgi:hypothetical protein
MCSVGVVIRFKALSLSSSCTSYCDYRKEQPIVFPCQKRDSSSLAVFINRWDTSCWWNSAVDLVEREVLKTRLSFKYFANRFVSSFYLKKYTSCKRGVFAFRCSDAASFLCNFFSAALTKLRKATVSFVRSSLQNCEKRLFRHVCLSGRPFGASQLHWTDFLEI